MTDFLSGLPWEILLLIVKELYPLDPYEARTDLWQWSETSTFFEQFITPLIIDVVELRCHEDWGCWLEDLASGPHGHLIKKIWFDAATSNCAWSESDPPEILPGSLERVLSNLHIFPGLELLSIRYCDELYEDLELDACTEEESEAEVEEAEKTDERRALMAGVYKALGQNEKIYAKGLELRDVSYKRTSSFADPSFHNFLNHLRTFSLSLKTGEIDMCQEFDASRCREYMAFTSKLDVFFFDHLSHVTSLTFKAPERGPLGLADSEMFLALKKDHMPHLQYVDLEYMAVHTELTDFFVGHAATLENVILRNCFVVDDDDFDVDDSDGDDSDVDDSSTMNFYWEHFLDSLRHAGCSKLRRFEILPVLPPFTWTEYMSHGKELPILQDPGHGQRLFAYLALDQGVVASPNVKAIHASLKKGRDQISYDRLMQIVDANHHHHEASNPRSS